MKRNIGLYLDDVFIHDYFEVNLDRIWNIIQNDLQPLKNKIIKILGELDS